MKVLCALAFATHVRVGLTLRQMVVALCRLKGLEAKEIAELTGLAKRTILRYSAQTRARLGAETQREADFLITHRLARHEREVLMQIEFEASTGSSG